MRFQKVASEEEAEGILLDGIRKTLNDGSKVLWLLPGGSNIKISVAVFKLLTEDELSRISVTLTDERFGPIGHPNSNYFQLEQAGFDFSKVKATPILVNKYDSFDETVERFERTINDLFAESQTIIGQFGMGGDGHIAGILPHSPAGREIVRLAVGYKTPDFTRITMTFNAILMIDKAYLIAFGESKLEALVSLRDKAIELNAQPAQILRQVNDVVVINDMIGEEE